MPHPQLTGAVRRTEAERLIALARSLLTEEAEQIAANYLDHAALALGALPPPASGTVIGRATPPSPDRARPAP